MLYAVDMPAYDSRSPFRWLAACWGALGLAGLLVFAVARLCGVIAVGWEAPWHWQHFAVAAANGLFMMWSEGHRGFGQAFSPRCAARVKWLSERATVTRGMLAPFFVMAYFGAPRRRAVATWVLTAFIVIAIVVVHALPQPWRAVLDVGVVLGLCWGLVTFFLSLWRTFRDPDYSVSAEVA